MLMPELQQMAQSLGITGVGRMRKSELITAIQARQSEDQRAGGASAEQEAPPVPDSDNTSTTEAAATADQIASGAATRRATRPAGPPQPRRVAEERNEDRSESRADESAAPTVQDRPAQNESNDDSDEDRPVRTRRRVRERGPRDEGENVRSRNDNAEPAESADSGDADSGPRGDQRGGDDGNRRRKRRDRSDRRRSRGNGSEEFEQRGQNQNSNDDQLVPVAGILDILDNYAFIRTTGYLSGPDDVYVSMSQVRKHRLRRGDAIIGAVKPNRGGDDNGGQGGKQRREKYNPLVRLDTVNGMTPDEARNRDEFYKLTPLYPQERLRLETEPNQLTTRVIDLVAPIGKGQRALVVSPPKAGKTMVLQAIANSITTNNPECHLMVVLVDERPEEVTDMQRSVKGEVIASTFDRPPSDHTTVAELSIERAKRLVELGHDVVVLLDSITRLGRAYNNASPASGRILSGGIDSTALYPPKRFLGAARNIENGGSLTIIGTALVETGSMGDTVIFEEFKGTGNAELKLDRKIAEKRTWPAIDVHASGTRKDELMMSAEEQAVMLRLRRVLSSLEPQQALDLLLDRLKKTHTNAEFLMSIVKQTSPE
jgi:transcription termination factor Rho